MRDITELTQDRVSCRLYFLVGDLHPIESFPCDIRVALANLNGFSFDFIVRRRFVYSHVTFWSDRVSHWVYRRKNATRLDHHAHAVPSADWTAHTRPSDHANEGRGFQQPRKHPQELSNCMIEDLLLHQTAGGLEEVLAVTAMAGTATMATSAMSCPCSALWTALSARP